MKKTIFVILKIISAPVALLYGAIIFIRNFLYDKNYLKSVQFDLPVICVGNITAGGTGKTPHVEYLIKLLSPYYKVATVSRGYRRRGIL
jgi:lipid-A-disaccharide kinase (EC 2.7.1.130)